MLMKEKSVKKEKECWERKKDVESYLSQIWVRSQLNHWLVLIITQSTH